MKVRKVCVCEVGREVLKEVRGKMLVNNSKVLFCHFNIEFKTLLSHPRRQYTYLPGCGLLFLLLERRRSQLTMKRVREWFAGRPFSVYLQNKKQHTLSFSPTSPVLCRELGKGLKYWRGEWAGYSSRPTRGFMANGIPQLDRLSFREKAKWRKATTTQWKEQKKCVNKEERRKKANYSSELEEILLD